MMIVISRSVLFFCAPATIDLLEKEKEKEGLLIAYFMIPISITRR